MASADIRPYLEALDEPALLVDRGIVRLANEAAKQLFGAPIEGSDVRLAIRHPQALEQILPGTPGDIDITGIARLGQPWTLSIRKVGERSLLIRLIDRSAAIAAEKMRVDFVANASHELRTPLAAVLGYAETIADVPDLEPPLRAQFGSIIRDEAKRMLRIIEDLMSLSRIEAGRFVAPSERVAMPVLIERAVANAQRLPGADQSVITASIEGGLPEVIGDEAQLAQLLDNLIGNAIRYGFRAGRCTVEVSAVAGDGTVAISVRDEGPGIPRDHLRRVTERFYRVDEARSRESGGTGLGLAIVKHIVERHKGMLDIRSIVGEGTHVTVRLPVAS
jgi:two-component system phosphate regulon sensor histidine kinase PhoR